MSALGVGDRIDFRIERTRYEGRVVSHSPGGWHVHVVRSTPECIHARGFGPGTTLKVSHSERIGEAP